MKRHFVSLLVAGILVASAPAALADPPHAGCARGPGQGGATGNGPWELWDQTTFAIAVEESFGDGAATAEVVYAKEDKNTDGLLCVTTQRLPNTSSGSDIWFVSHDNTAGR